MEKYVTQLIEDIKSAHHKSVEEDVPQHTISFEEEMEAVEKWVEGEDAPPSLSYKCGLNADQFPPVEQLTETQLDLIMEAFQTMLSSWNLHASFPENLPKVKAYPLLISVLEREAWFLPGGILVFDFCTGYAPECVMKEYCPCLEIWNKKEVTRGRG